MGFKNLTFGKKLCGSACLAMTGRTWQSVADLSTTGLALAVTLFMYTPAVWCIYGQKLESGQNYDDCCATYSYSELAANFPHISTLHCALRGSQQHIQVCNMCSQLFTLSAICPDCIVQCAVCIIHLACSIISQQAALCSIPTLLTKLTLIIASTCPAAW